MDPFVDDRSLSLSEKTGRAGGGPFEAFLANLAAERPNWPLWLPVALGFGIAIYFFSPVEPPLWLAFFLAAGPLAAVVGFRKSAGWRLLFFALAMMGIGFATAKIRTLLVAAPVLEIETGFVTVEGRIHSFEVLPEAFRVTLSSPRIEGIEPAATPERVRIRLRRDQERDRLKIGESVRVRAKLSPPRPPTAPGHFDFQRYAFFQGLGAVGFAVGPLGGAEGEVAAERGGLGEAVEKVRQRIFDRVLAVLPSAEGAITAALMTGKRDAISDDVLAAMRDSGLAHLLAISGLHISLVAGVLFFTLRALLALVEPIALRFHIKKWAAVAALLGAFAYLEIAGATLPTQRAFVMLSLVMLAVLLDRSGISMRLIAWAAFIVLLVQPEALLGASFQLSFAAVVALVAVYEGLGAFWIGERAKRGVFRRIGYYLMGVGLTTLVAGLATAPYAIQHFNRFTEYGLAANLVAVPLTALWIMPWAVIAFLLMPFGFDSFALVPMGWGVEGVIWTAKTVAGWPGSVALLPAMTGPGFLALTLGGLWLCLWRRRWRYLGFLGIAAGLLTVAFSSPPDVLVSGDGKLFAVRAEGGGYRFSSRQAARFAGQNWLRMTGETVPLPWPKEGVSEDGRLACDGLGCLYRAEAAGQMVALVFEAGTLAEDCAVAVVLVSREPVSKRSCPEPKVVIDRFDLWRDGGHAVWIGKKGVRVRSVRAARGNRPWVLAPKQREK